MELPDPKCPDGYTLSQVREVFGTGKTRQFERFMRESGLPLAVCTGWKMSSIFKTEYPTTCCGDPHGTLYYKIDLVRFQQHLEKELVEVA